MTVMELFGAMMVVFAPPGVIFWVFVRKSAKLVIVTYAAAFAWLLSTIASSVLWHIVTPLKDSAWWSLSVLIPLQLLFRYLFWLLLKKAERGLNTLGDDGQGVITREKMAFVSGFGFGVMGAVMQFSIVLDAMTGPGTLPSPGCPDDSFFAISALMASCFFLLNVCWTVILYDGLEQRFQRGPGGGVSVPEFKIVFVVASYFFASYLTINNREAGTCAGTLVPLYLLLLFTAVIAWKTADLVVRYKGRILF
eukprot:m.54209 g.54209  ORF g.54209 m.54209 type:complete len:251 (-) comp15492_c0_seq4:62-814(-)